MSDNRPPIPEGIKREVRQRCGFGCVMCGIPVYHYDHMDEYNVVQEHTAANITLLCGYHHDLKTRGQLPTAVVRAKNENPHNERQGQTATHSLFYFGDYAEIVAGGNSVVVANRSASALMVDGDSLLDFELVDGNLMLNLAFCDAAGSPVLTVRRNELVHSTHLWDYEFTGKTLSIRERERQIYLTVVFDAGQHRVLMDKGLVTHNGVDLLFDPRGLCILNNCFLLSGNSAGGVDAAISVGHSSGSAAIHVEIDRGPYDRKAALAWAREKMEETVSSRPYAPRSSRQPPVRASIAAARRTWISIATLPYPWARASCGLSTWWP